MFDGIKSKDLMELSKHIVITRVEANTLMIRQGDYPGYCYVVLSGELKVIRRMNSQKLSYDKFEDYSKQQFSSAMGVLDKAKSKRLSLYDVQSNTV